MPEDRVVSDRLKRHVVWVCAGCDECEPLDGAPRSRFPCTDSPSLNGAEVVLAQEHEAELERLREQVAEWQNWVLGVAMVASTIKSARKGVERAVTGYVRQAVALRQIVRHADIPAGESWEQAYIEVTTMARDALALDEDQADG